MEKNNGVPTNLDLMTALEGLSKVIFDYNLQMLAQTDEYQRTLVGKPIMGLGFMTDVLRHSNAWDLEPVDSAEAVATAEKRILYVTNSGRFQPYKASTTNVKELAKIDRTNDLQHRMAKTLLDAPGQVSHDIDSEAFRLSVTGAKNRAQELDSHYNSKNKLVTLLRVTAQAVGNSSIWVPYYSVSRMTDRAVGGYEISGNESYSFLKAYLANAPKLIETRQRRSNQLSALTAPKEVVEQEQEKLEVLKRQVQKAKDAQGNFMDGLIGGKGMSEMQPTGIRYL